MALVLPTRLEENLTAQLWTVLQILATIDLNIDSVSLKLGRLELSWCVLGTSSNKVILVTRLNIFYFLALPLLPLFFFIVLLFALFLKLGDTCWDRLISWLAWRRLNRRGHYCLIVQKLTRLSSILSLAHFQGLLLGEADQIFSRFIRLHRFSNIVDARWLGVIRCPSLDRVAWCLKRLMDSRGRSRASVIDCAVLTWEHSLVVVAPASMQVTCRFMVVSVSDARLLNKSLRRRHTRSSWTLNRLVLTVLLCLHVLRLVKSLARVWLRGWQQLPTALRSDAPTTRAGRMEALESMLRRSCDDPRRW